MDLGVLLRALKLGGQPGCASTRHSSLDLGEDGGRQRGQVREAVWRIQGGGGEDGHQRGGWRSVASWRRLLVALHVAGCVHERETERLHVLSVHKRETERRQG
jgi:hypothetical protein